jgi:U2-associated protein SR140
VTPNVPDIQVIPPEDEHLRHVIDTTAMYVLDDNCAFEQAIMQRGRGKPLFSFLFDLASNDHTYYIWRLYSFAQVSSLTKDRLITISNNSLYCLLWGDCSSWSKHSICSQSPV